jgi:alkylhydroperoxidase family enzyme
VTAAVLADYRTAPVSGKVRAALAFLEEVTLRPAELGAQHAAPLRAAGVSRQAAEDALAVAFGFNLIDRLADAFGWHVPEQAGFDASAKVLLAHGYRMPLRASSGGARR